MIYIYMGTSYFKSWKFKVLCPFLLGHKGFKLVVEAKNVTNIYALQRQVPFTIYAI